MEIMKKRKILKLIEYIFKKALTFFLIFLFLFSGLFEILLNTYIHASVEYTWVADTQGDWLDASNWDPSGFINSAGDTAEVFSGSLETNATATFAPTLIVHEGAEILGHTANGRTWTLTNTILNGGTIRSQGGNSSFIGTIEAKEGAISYLDASDGLYSSRNNNWTLKGAGTLIKTGSSYWGLPTTSSDFTGLLIIREGCELAH